MERRRNLGLGLLLLVAGVFFLALNLGWLPGVGPFVVVIIGLGFLLLHLVVPNWEWPVFPGSFMTMIGLVIVLIETGAVDGEMAWPGFVLAPGLAFFLIALLAPEHRQWAYVPGGIVSLIGLVFLVVNVGLGPDAAGLVSQLLVPLGLIVAGVYFLVVRRR